MRALVTGGAGFIGSNLTDALLARGDEVIVVDDLSTGRRENLERALANGRDAGRGRHPRPRRDRGDRRPRASRGRSSTWPPRSTCASRSPTPPSTPRSTSAAPPTCSRRPARPRCAAIVFSSTGGAIYGEGDGQELPLAEDAPLAPEAPYGQSKFAGEGYLSLYERLYGLSTHPAAARQRLRPAPGPARRGRRGRDLLRQAARGQAADRLRRRQADPRLHICGRRGLGDAGRGRVGDDRPGQHRHRDRDRRAGAGQRRSASSAATATSSPSSPRRAPARCSASRSTRPAPSASWAGRRRWTSARACASPSTRSEPAQPGVTL